MGQPNCGKSSLFNSLIASERCIVDNHSGTTMDAIATEFDFKGRKFSLMDTPGLDKGDFSAECAVFLKGNFTIFF